MNKYFIKSFLLKSWLFEEYKKVGRTLFWFHNSKFLGQKWHKVLTENDYSVEKAMDINRIYSNRYCRLWKECKKLYHSHLNRVIRLKKRITDMVLNHSCIFLTITFTDEYLSNLSARTRKEYIKEFLCSLGADDYVANIDFGDNHLYKDKKGVIRQATSREHFHAVVQIDKVNYKLWKYGRINGQRVRNQTTDLTRISKYVSKLTNHAIKESTKRCCILYKRKTKNKGAKI